MTTIATDDTQQAATVFVITAFPGELRAKSIIYFGQTNSSHKALASIQTQWL